jgi:uncharacterized protein (DUF305 family)
MSMMDHSMMGHTMTITDKKSFALAMVPHHQQAVVMSNFALKNTMNPQLLEIARQIIAEQEPEIQKMTPWLEGSPVNENMVMDGMLTTAQLAELSAATGSVFDRLYVEYMVMHHQGAITMAEIAITLPDSELVMFASAIIEAQTAEIQTLSQILPTN